MRIYAPDMGDCMDEYVARLYADYEAAKELGDEELISEALWEITYARRMYIYI